MRKFSIILLLSFIICIAFNNCKPDVDVTGPYQENIVVYGLLNASSSPQIIKIYKSYNGQGNALDMAQVTDSINFKKGTLEVQLMKMKGNIVEQTIPLTDTVIPTQSGTFTSNQTAYYTNTPLIQDGSIYKLSAKSLKTGKTVTASTLLVANPNFQSSSSLKFYITSTNAYNEMLFTCPKSTNGYIYEYYLRFHYKEINVLDTNIQDTTKFVDLKLGTTFGTSAEMQFRASGKAFFEKVASTIPVDNTVFRKAMKCDLTILIGSEEFYNYETIYASNNSINQSKPVFTNVQNGIGLFSSRGTFVKTGFTLNNDTKNWLKNLNSPTGNLNFQN